MSIIVRSAAIAAFVLAANVAAQQSGTATVSAAYHYADLADLALAAPITAHVKIKSAKRLSKELSVGVRPGSTRVLVTADVIALIKASGEVPRRIRFLMDLPIDSRGKIEKLTKSESLIFAMDAGPGALRLVAPDAFVRWTPDNARVVRAILSEASKADAPPVVRGISSAFHSAGSIPGEGETQIFLNSSDEKPVSLTVQRQASEAPRWFVSQGEVVDEGTSQPRPDTLLWYRIACTLPPKFPAAATEGQPPAAVDQIAVDYRLILDQIGRCVRTRKQSSSS